MTPTSTPTPTPPTPTTPTPTTPTSTPTSPTRSRTLTWVGMVAMVPITAWALWPLPMPAIPAPREPEQATSATTVRAAFDAEAFRVPLWVAPPSPPTPEPEPTPPPPPPPPPLKLQLLSILREEDGNRVMLYDPDAQKVLTLSVGDDVGHGRSITSITDRELTITGPRGNQSLSLRDAQPPSSGKPGRPR